MEEVESRSKKEMSSSNKERSRYWTADETQLFAYILANEEDKFAESLEGLALKRSANNEVFEHTRLFDKARHDNQFKVANEKNIFCFHF